MKKITVYRFSELPKKVQKELMYKKFLDGRLTQYPVPEDAKTLKSLRVTMDSIHSYEPISNEDEVYKKELVKMMERFEDNLMAKYIKNTNKVDGDHLFYKDGNRFPDTLRDFLED